MKKPKKKLKGRERRLAKAQEWVWKHRAKPANMLKKYRKHFGVDWECAITELQEFGVEFDEEYLAQLRSSLAPLLSSEKKHQPISKEESDSYNGIEPESDANFAYIAGYTTGGVPFGITWEEMEENDDSQESE